MMELPLGFGMALAQNEAAMHVFEAMTDAEKQAVLEQCHHCLLYTSPSPRDS